MIDLFFSYSHRDEALRDELEIHLTMLKRQGLIRAWHDRRINAGQEFDQEINTHLEEADVILLLMSPYFLASDYCYEREATRALERHTQGAAVVIPVILEPCDWLNSPFKKLLATPTDGRPVTKFPNKHDAFLEITKEIRRAAESLGRDTPAVKPASPAPVIRQPELRTSNLRIKKLFTDQDRDTFVDEAFSYIRTFFENSLVELSARNPDVEQRFRSTGEAEFTAAIYIAGEKRASCRIWTGGRDGFVGDIAYSGTDSPSRGINESMHVETDGYTLGLKPMGMFMRGNGRDELLSPQGAAEYFWTALIERLQ